MSLSRSRIAVRTILRLVGELLRLVGGAVPSRAQLSAENLFLRKQLALYVERQAKPRRADDATRITLVALSWLIDWRRALEVVKPDTLRSTVTVVPDAGHVVHLDQPEAVRSIAVRAFQVTAGE